MGWNFEEMADPVNARRALDCLAENLDGETKIISYYGGRNMEPALYGPGKGKREELILALALEDRTDRKRTASIVWVSADTVKGKRGFWWKETPESMGPCVYAPPQILDLLTPTKSEEAKAWREESRTAWEKQGKPAQA